MGESDLHRLLKKIGMAWLYNQQCFMVADEIWVWKHDDEPHELDNHWIMDVVGAGKKYIPYMQRPHTEKYKDYYNEVLRGIEVKVSRSDFKNGFVTSGCNYHYLLTPMRLVSPAEIPSWMGLLEYNKHKFDISYSELGKFNFKGLRVVKKPKFRTISETQLKRGLSGIGQRLSTLVKSNLVEFLCQDSEEKGDNEE